LNQHSINDDSTIDRWD